MRTVDAYSHILIILSICSLSSDEFTFPLDWRERSLSNWKCSFLFSFHNVSPRYGQPLLWAAAARGRAAVVHYLVSSFPFLLEIANEEDGTTPLMLAIESGDHDTAAKMITAGANVTAESLAGNSVAHFAALNCQHKIIPLLQGSGADLNKGRSADGLTPFRAAFEGRDKRGCVETVRVIAALAGISAADKQSALAQGVAEAEFASIAGLNDTSRNPRAGEEGSTFPTATVALILLIVVLAASFPFVRWRRRVQQQRSRASSTARLRTSVLQASEVIDRSLIDCAVCLSLPTHAVLLPEGRSYCLNCIVNVRASGAGAILSSLAISSHQAHAHKYTHLYIQ